MSDRILLVGNFLSASMVTRHVCEDMERNLRANGWEVLTTSRTLARLPKVLDMVQATWRWRKQYGLAHVECYSGSAFTWAELVGWSLGWLKKPFILTLHSGNFPDFARRHPGRVRRLFGRAALVTTPSGYLQEKMQPYRADLRLLPNALDFTNYTYRSRSPLQPRLVWLRGFLDYYNPFMGPRVVAALQREFPDLHLTMIGPDKGDGSWQATQQLAKELGVQDRVSFPGGVPKADVPAWLERHDIFINTTNRDNTPVSVMEAMAAGLNVVSTNVDGIPYLLSHGQDSLLVGPNDVDAMAAAVRRLLTEPVLASRLALQARRKVASFDWAEILPQWETIYRSLLPTAVGDVVGSLNCPVR